MVVVVTACPLPQVREPVAVKKALESIRAGVTVAARRVAGSPSALPPISRRDLLEGTCLRFDTQDTGVLGVDELRQVGALVVPCARPALSEASLQNSYIYSMLMQCGEYLQEKSTCNQSFRRIIVESPLAPRPPTPSPSPWENQPCGWCALFATGLWRVSCYCTTLGLARA